MNSNKNSLVLVDAHVHIQIIYNLEEYFIAVFNNFSDAANELDKSKNWTGFLMLTEVVGINQFEKLKELESIGSKKFFIHETEENNSLKITSAEGHSIFIIAGKQIIAKNNIEVLALCTNSNIEEQKSVIETVQNINSQNGIAVLPWGVGKWTGERKKIIEKFLIENKNEKFFLGDNSGRPIFWNDPQIFKIGNSTNHFVLPGSDALAIASEVNKTASFGFYAYGKINETNPTDSIKKIIQSLETPPNQFGKLENPISFLKNQITMQIIKRRKKK